jgi:hypothetical protein
MTVNSTGEQFPITKNFTERDNAHCGNAGIALRQCHNFTGGVTGGALRDISIAIEKSQAGCVSRSRCARRKETPPLPRGQSLRLT